MATAVDDVSKDLGLDGDIQTTEATEATAPKLLFFDIEAVRCLLFC